MIIDKEIEVAEKVGDGYFTYKDARELQETLTDSLLRDTKELLDEEEKSEEGEQEDSPSEVSNMATGFSKKSLFVGTLLLFLFLSVAAGIGNDINK